MAVIKAVSSKAGIGQALDYVTKEEKTEDKLVSGLHCEPDTVKDEMQATKELWEKTSPFFRGQKGAINSLIR